MIEDLAAYFIRYAVVESIWNKCPVQRAKWFKVMDTGSFEVICEGVGSDVAYQKRLVLENMGTEKPYHLEIPHTLDGGTARK